MRLESKSAYSSIYWQQFILLLKVMGGWDFCGLRSSFPMALARLRPAGVGLEAEHVLLWLHRSLTGLLAVSLQVQPPLRVLAVQVE